MFSERAAAPDAQYTVIKLADGSAEITIEDGWQEVQREDNTIWQGQTYVLTKLGNGMPIPWREYLADSVGANLSAWIAAAQTIEADAQAAADKARQDAEFRASEETIITQMRADVDYTLMMVEG
jgi:hypothetical protein